MHLQRDTFTETNLTIPGHVNRQSLPLDNSIFLDRPHRRTNVNLKKTVGPLYYKVMVLHYPIGVIVEPPSS